MGDGMMYVHARPLAARLPRLRARRPACAAPCSPNVLQLVPPGCADDCALWHASLDRFGAEQLNDRFRAAGFEIDDPLWLGWFAVKLLWEAGVRDRSARAMSFDGHRGVPLHFNDAGVLVQPAYTLSEGKVAGQVTLGEVATCRP